MYIKELTRHIESWNEGKQPISQFSLKIAMIMPAILLQKPCKNSKSKQHTEYLAKRLELWFQGNFELLMKEGRAIQEKLKLNSSKFDTPEHTTKVFSKLMLQGKVHAALRVLDKASNRGVASMSEETMEKLHELHPEAQEASDETLATGELPYFDPVVFSCIDEDSIAKAALRTRGAAGPSGQDAESWRRMLVSKNFGKVGKDLRTAIAKMTKILCTRELETPDYGSIEAYTANRLIPLEKEPSGIRPIGIGEVLRRIIGKAVIAEVRVDVMESAGCVQLCAGQRSGCEAAAHAMSEIFEDEESDGVLFIDASNAFNSLNRRAFLHNIQYLCPPMATYLRNCYHTPSRLFVAGGGEIMSSEGTTQGDPLAMPAYGISILPLLTLIKADDARIKQIAYADDIGSGSKLANLRQWWDRIVRYGPLLGYYPKASKSWLVVKKAQLVDAAEIFAGTGINITTEGRKYLGGFVGTTEGAEKYVKELVNEWLEQLDELGKIAKSEPQSAYSAFTAGFKHKLTYFMRTIPNLEEILKPIDDFLDNVLIPILTEGHQMSPDDRKLWSLPVRLGGMGFPIFSELCKVEYESSLESTESLRPKIIAQDPFFVHDKKSEKQVNSRIQSNKNARNKQILDELRSRMSLEQVRANDICQMKGASAWLTALPLKEEGYVLSKREFFDAVSLRYRWDIKRLPINCVCSKPFTADHAMSCKNGGYIHRRHDRIRDIFAGLLDDVAHGVCTEPPLQPLSGEILNRNANEDPNARLDIEARGFWQDSERALFDIKVFNPFAKSHLATNLESAFKINEKQKKTAYNMRVVKVEHASFTPVVLSSSGGFGVETSKFVSTLSHKTAEKKDIVQSVVANYIRTKVSFELVKSQVACLRGSRRKGKMKIDGGEIELVSTAASIRE